MDLRIVEDPQAVARGAADFLAEIVSAKPAASVAWPTGRTPVAFYDELASRHSRGAIDLSRVRSFHLDELILPKDDPRTFRSFFQKHLFGRTGIEGQMAEAPDCQAMDLGAECERYEGLLRSTGLDLAILGLGVDGHVAYDLPGTARPRTHVVTLPDETAAEVGIAPEDRPLRAISVGLETLADARRILVMATGRSKVEAVRALVRGGSWDAWPCAFLTSHGSIAVYADREAASGL